jgi:hypothetical protein
MEHAHRADLDPYVTRDGSTIREWAGPYSHQDTVLLEGK